jgi:hypothetical protein
MRTMQRLLRVHIEDSNGMTVFMVLCWCGQFKQIPDQQLPIQWQQL